MILDASYFEKLFHDGFSPELVERINGKNLACVDISEEEKDYCILTAVKYILQDGAVKAGAQRIEQWENGWSENLLEFKESGDKNALIPKYFRKSTYSRLNQRFVKGISPDYDHMMLTVILDWLFDKYLKGNSVKNIYEFGCGTGHNLLHAREYNTNAEIVGLDWAKSSQICIQNMNLKGISGYNFDYFNPDYNFHINKGGIVFTVASLEQTGENYKEFLDYLLSSDFSICIHVEPIAELLDQTNLPDYLSIMYFKKRNYLSGYLNYLESLEQQGKIEILQKQRTYIGSMFIDGYSVIVWKKL
jgi:SAM-dependent methyltransferase